jgi:hypothetical protein
MARYCARPCVLSTRGQSNRCAAERSSVSIDPRASLALTPGQEVLQCSARLLIVTCRGSSWLRT